MFFLQIIYFNNRYTIPPQYHFDWAIEMITIFKEKISNRDFASLIHYGKLNATAQLAIPTPDHYYPLLYFLALQDDQDEVIFFTIKPLVAL